MNRRFTLIVGNSGTGKSSLLDALSVAFGSFLLGIPVGAASARHINQREAHESERDFDGMPEFNKVYPVVVEAEDRITHPLTGKDKDIRWRRQGHPTLISAGFP